MPVLVANSESQDDPAPGLRHPPYLRRGLYNVSRFQAVEFEPKDGRRFRLGTDEPEPLIRAVTVNIGQSAHA